MVSSRFLDIATFVPEPAPVARNSQWSEGVTKEVKAARKVFSVIGRMSQRVSASCAAMAFLRPPRSAPRPGERRVLARGTVSFVRGSQGRMAVWRWGTGPCVLLVHGWGGHAGRLSRFVPALTAAGFGVAAFDAPAHGTSDGWLASLPDFVEAIGVVASEVAPVALIGHSMGAAACALAARGGLDVDATVLVAPFVDPEKYTSRFARYLRLSEAATAGMKQKLQERYRVRFEDLMLLTSPPSVRTLVVHDRGDWRVPIHDGMAVARTWPRASLLETRGLGHHKILRSALVVEKAVEFIRGPVFTETAARVSVREAVRSAALAV
jgi:pimeloyl-ACP methyl ester carboxylesterase